MLMCTTWIELNANVDGLNNLSLKLVSRSRTQSERTESLPMGCTASRPELDELPQQLQDWPHGHGRGISMATAHAQNTGLMNDFNIVPLSSSSYGINMQPGELAAENGQIKLSGYDGSIPGQEEKDSMTHMLQLLESLDMGNGEPGSTQSKQSDQVSSILEDLKPGLERHFSQALGKPFNGATSPALQPLAGKENARPIVVPSPPRESVNSPMVQKGSASPGASVKPTKSKSSFASRFLKRSSSSLGSQKRNGSRGKAGDGDDLSAHVHLQSAKGPDGSLLFDSDFLASYESALKELTPDDWNALKDGAGQRQHDDDDQIARKEDEEKVQLPIIKPLPVVKKCVDPLEKYDKVCPPGGENSVVLYTTSLRGIRKTFEDCNGLRSVLESFQVIVDERDVAMHQGFRNELREMMGNRPVPVPRLFIKGRYIGGAEDVLQLHEEEELAPLLEGLPRDRRGSTHPCDGCGGARFVPCLECSGSRKVVDPDNGKEVIRCPDCNENGLIQCPICS
ncbi:hypothetical protein GOP47_0021146 [Adiantum capillus-veneris]|uniref:Glutaredoxin domain-containing protein n=1 Tax=Adiantum capillus-veneris TaxID=13818 RepID=A0A9D4UAK5_ADICA|nr:hypothetical protein GOP47_0021146 [Adiantum capillus-veneris]